MAAGLLVAGLLSSRLLEGSGEAVVPGIETEDMRELGAMRAAEVETVIFSAGRGVPDPVRFRVSGVPVLLRMLRVLRRAGQRHITLVSEELPEAVSAWAEELDLELRQVRFWKANGDPALLLSADLAFQKEFLTGLLDQWRPRRWIESVPEGDGTAPVMLGEGLIGDFRQLEEAREAVRRQVRREHLVTFNGEPACVRISDRRQAQRFHRLVEGSITKPTDAVFARWNRRVSIPLSRLLVQLPISPNMVTYLALLVSAVGAWYLSLGGYWEMLWGALLTQVASILDGNDGELARLKVMDSDYGTWLDTICDYLAYFLTFGGVTVGLFRRTGDPFYLQLGGLLLLGIALGMLATSYFRKRHTSAGQASDLTAVVMERLDRNRSNPVTNLAAKLHHFATRATFTYFIVLFGVLDWWYFLLAIAAVGAQLYWLACLYHAKFLEKA